jgi:hypothetical protein
MKPLADACEMRGAPSTGCAVSRVAKRVLSVVLCCFVLVTCGCGAEPRSPPAYVPPPKVGNQLVSAKQIEDLGVIPRGYQQAIAFPISNPSERLLKLAIVHSSCTCLNATIDQVELAARASTTVRAKVHAAETSIPGPLVAEVKVAASGSGGEKYSSTFSIRAVVEGLSMEPVIARVPAVIASWEPKPLRGVFYCDRTRSEVEVIDLEWLGTGCPEGIAIGEPTLSAVQDLGDYTVRTLAVPLRVEAPRRPIAGVYEGRVVYSVHGIESRTSFVVQIVDALE